MFRFNHHRQGAYYLSFAKVIVILTDYFNNYNFSKAEIISSLMMVIKPKHVRAVLM
jgi:hypothetical protein